MISHLLRMNLIAFKVLLDAGAATKVQSRVKYSSAFSIAVGGSVTMSVLTVVVATSACAGAKPHEGGAAVSEGETEPQAEPSSAAPEPGT